MIKQFILGTFLLTAINYTVQAQATLKPGTWRGALKTAGGQDIPFNFDVTNAGGKQQLAIINSTERFKVTDISSRGDSVFIKMPLFDSEFKLRLAANKLQGQYIRHLGDKDVPMEFAATAATPYRFFKNPAKPAFNVSGRWSAVFGEGEGRDTTVGEFKQAGAKVTGTFLTTTGDYRFLEGTVAGDSLYLSCFDGGHAFLFTAKIKDNNTLADGKFFSGVTGKDVWGAIRNEQAKLPDAYSLTALKPGYKKLAFNFKDLNGQPVSLDDARFKNKVVIVQILGSWCPNCMDETAYMVNYYKKYQPKGVEVVGLAYERTADFAKSQRTVTQMKNRFDIKYPLLITGYTSNKAETAKSLPMLAKVVGFPTTIIIDKKGDVRKIHTGFSGPGTGSHYTEFISEFEKLTNDLLAEKLN
ncbi:TlpA family protein disulfide reductase [Mucilaginibacter pallidiroseus]|uniref:TlpA family protein disulfide reductase n=1 Tax=Mucilaginibacter pallidiroseus TaxID=2599295 RepID=A0A563UGQ2_9SPHI|nr:TlpA disulfide reductase family protein [Mucilaginibacter pallidiroseus]TWR30521.1 TlpA family protein disulfide reductase [Mucilaginibacter pallidiroseus]